MVNCEVKFDNNGQGIYYAGQNLSGVIELNNDKTRKIRGVSLRIEGFAKCKWTESEGTGKHRRTISYSGREDYINTFSYLIGSVQENQTELSAGIHKFNFACMLPHQLPTSFESKYGYIRYQIKVEIERPWKFDTKFSFGFTVIKVLDLNYEGLALRSPMKAETTKTFFFGLSSKALFMSAETPISGFVAGQTVPITIRINNDSNVEVEETKITLKKIIRYNSQAPRRKTRERIESAAEMRHLGVPSKNKGHIEAHLVIPPVPPTNFTSCNVIQVTYEIHVTAKVGGIHRSPVVRLPLTIGTVPLQAYQYSSLPPAGQMMNWAMPSTSNASAPLPSYASQAVAAPPSGQHSHDMPPPSYHQAMGMTSNDGDTDEGLTEDKPFSPMYPVFSFNNSNPPLVPTQQGDQPPPSYGFVAPEYQEKKGY